MEVSERCLQAYFLATHSLADFMPLPIGSFPLSLLRLVIQYKKVTVLGLPEHHRSWAR